jgi:putative endonuclease
MSDNLIKGNSAEQKACEFLENEQYTILERNYRYKKGEIDIIAKQQNTIVFVEVRFRTKSDYGFPEQTVSLSKIKLLWKTAENYVLDKDWKGNIRFDTIAMSETEFVHLQDVWAF